MLKDDILEFVGNYEGETVIMNDFMNSFESFLESKKEQKKVEILITVEGGAVQNVTSRDDKRIEAVIIDFDADSNIHKDCDGEDIEAYIYEVSTEPNSDVLDFYFKELKRIEELNN